MNKQLLYIPVFLLGFTACSTPISTETSVSQQAETTKTAPAKSHKRRHKALPEGVISVDIVNSDNRLHLLSGKHQQGRKSLWYQYSNDGGKSWSAGSKVLNDHDLAVKMVRGNDAQIAVQRKNIVVSWTKFDSSSRFKAGVMMTARSVDKGQSWQYTQSPPDWQGGPHGYIDMAADDYALHAVWLDSRNGESQALQYARSIDGGLSWQANITLDNHSCSCCWNTIKSDAEGNAYVLYRDKKPSDLSLGVIDRQQQWQWLNHVGAFNWQFDGCPHIGGGLDFQTIADKTRQHAVAGTAHPEHLGIHYLFSDDSGKTWSAAKQLGDESAIHADVAAHDNGRVIVVWDMMAEDGLAIFAAESKDQGASWSSPKQISNKGIRATHPRIVKTEQGFLSIWTENDGQKQTLISARL